ncbi:response regulator [soil metagenome]
MAEAREALRGLKVLVVEDSFLVADDLAATIAELGCEVVGPAASLQDGLRLAGEPGLAGAFLDVNLSRSGTSFAIAEKLEERGVPFVFLSGYDLDTAFPPAFRSAARLPKPVDPQHLARALMRFLAARRR